MIEDIRSLYDKKDDVIRLKSRAFRNRRRTFRFALGGNDFDACLVARTD